VRPRDHLGLLVIATLAWAAFLVGGLPDYYQQYSTRFMVWFVIAVLVPIAGLAWFVLRRVGPERRLGLSAWLAFWFTVPLAIYDWLYCGVYLGHGLGFLGRYWYLTVYYAIPWVLLPLIAVALGRSPVRRSESSR